MAVNSFSGGEWLRIAGILLWYSLSCLDFSTTCIKTCTPSLHFHRHRHRLLSHSPGKCRYFPNTSIRRSRVYAQSIPAFLKVIWIHSSFRFDWIDRRYLHMCRWGRRRRRTTTNQTNYSSRSYFFLQKLRFTVGEEADSNLRPKSILNLARSRKMNMRTILNPGSFSVDFNWIATIDDKSHWEESILEPRGSIDFFNSAK